MVLNLNALKAMNTQEGAAPGGIFDSKKSEAVQSESSASSVSVSGNSPLTFRKNPVISVEKKPEPMNQNNTSSARKISVFELKKNLWLPVEEEKKAVQSVSVALLQEQGPSSAIVPDESELLASPVQILAESKDVFVTSTHDVTVPDNDNLNNQKYKPNLENWVSKNLDPSSIVRSSSWKKEFFPNLKLVHEEGLHIPMQFHNLNNEVRENLPELEDVDDGFERVSDSGNDFVSQTKQRNKGIVKQLNTAIEIEHDEVLRSASLSEAHLIQIESSQDKGDSKESIEHIESIPVSTQEEHDSLSVDTATMTDKEIAQKNQAVVKSLNIAIEAEHKQHIEASSSTLDSSMRLPEKVTERQEAPLVQKDHFEDFAPAALSTSVVVKEHDVKLQAPSIFDRPLQIIHRIFSSVLWFFIRFVTTIRARIGRSLTATIYWYRDFTLKTQWNIFIRSRTLFVGVGIITIVIVSVFWMKVWQNPIAPLSSDVTPVLPVVLTGASEDVFSGTLEPSQIPQAPSIVPTRKKNLPAISSKRSVR